MAGQIEQVRAFLAVLDAGGFSAAARRLGMAPSQMTRAVADLEQALGAQLLVRTTRSVSPTRAGADYAARVRPLAAALARADEELRAEQNAIAGRLSVSAPLSLGQRFLPTAIARFRILYPQVALRLELSDRFVDILTEEFDMALRISGPPSDKSTIWRKICRVERRVVAAPGYIAGAPPLERPADLARHACLGYAHQAGGDAWVLIRSDGGARQSVTVAPPLECNNGEVIADLAAEGAGVAILPAFIVGAHLARGALVAVLPGWEPPPVWLTVYFPPYERLPARVEAFSRFIEDAVLADPSMLR
jgi:DNA-binding transcriptional LysR family regulator